MRGRIKHIISRIDKERRVSVHNIGQVGVQNNLWDCSLDETQEWKRISMFLTRLPPSVRLQPKSCNPCPDNSELECGSTSTYSVYYVQPNFTYNYGFKYWQCVNYYLYNPIEEVINVSDMTYPELYRFITQKFLTGKSARAGLCSP